MSQLILVCVEAGRSCMLLQENKQVHIDGAKIFKKRFYLDKLIGKGIQGVVFSAYDTVTMKKVGVKIMDKKCKDIDQQRREIKVLKELGKLKDNEGFPSLVDY